MKGTLGIIAALLVMSACSAGEATSELQARQAVTSTELSNAGGCWRQVYAADADWTEALQITLEQPELLVVGEPTDLQLGSGFSANRLVGTSLSTFLCNDVVVSDAAIDAETAAKSGSITVTVGQQFPRDEDLGGLTSIGVVVVVNELVFADGDSETLITGLTINTHIGWLPG